MKNGIFGKRLFAGLVILLVVAFAGSTAVAHELDDIRAAIHERGAHWVAGETSISKLPQHERLLRLGHVKHRLNGDETLLTATGTTGTGAAAAYTSFDWTYPTSYVTPVRNQGNCGSCWAFATTAALESYTLIKNSLPGQELNLAEQVMVSCGGAGSCGGGYVGSAANYIKNTGLPAEECYPYTATNGTCSTACYNWQSNSYKIAGWAYVATTSPTVDAIKNALVTYGPLVTTFDVYADFFSYVSGIYQHTSGTYQGGHAVLIVGFDDASQCFKVKNSWGTGWGEGGYFRIAYSELTSAVGFGEYTIAYTGAAPQPPPPSPDPQPTTCTFTLSPTSKTFTDKGGKGNITVTTGASCTWSVLSTAAWATVPNTLKTGSGSVTYTIAPNTTTESRSASINITASGSSSAAGSVSIIEKGKRR